MWINVKSLCLLQQTVEITRGLACLVWQKRTNKKKVLIICLQLNFMFTLSRSVNWEHKLKRSDGWKEVRDLVLKSAGSIFSHIYMWLVYLYQENSVHHSFTGNNTFLWQISSKFSSTLEKVCCQVRGLVGWSFSAKQVTVNVSSLWSSVS